MAENLLSGKQVTPGTSDPTNFVDEFDPPHVEEIEIKERAPGGEIIKRKVEVSFARADMDYWSQKGTQLREKRRREDENALNQIRGLDQLTKLQAQRQIRREQPVIQSLLEIYQYTPDGITQLLKDAMSRAGLKDDAEQKRVLRHIGPVRQQDIAILICSEPVPTVNQLRDAVRMRCAKIGMLPAQIAALTDEDLIRIASEPDPAPTETGDLAAGGGESPLESAAEGMSP